MTRRDAFWPAFWTGMAGPVTIYGGSPPDYWAYVGGYTVAQTFSIVGSTLGFTTGSAYAGQPEIQSTAGPESAGTAGFSITIPATSDAT